MRSASSRLAKTDDRPVTDRRVRKSVAVVGAGIGGLCAARTLIRTGDYRVEVFERAERAGGVIHTSRVDGFVREHAANGFLPVRDGTGAIDLARELGVEVVEAQPAAKKRWIYRHGQLHQVPTSPARFIKSRLLSTRGKLELLAEPLRRPGPADDESIYSFAKRRLGAEVADALVAPFVTGIFAGNARDVSVRAGFPMLVELEQKGGLVVGQLRTMVQRMRSRRRNPDAQARSSGSGKRARLSAPRAGAGELVDALVRELGDALVTGAEIARVAPGPRLHFADGSVRAFDAVVLATPAPVAADLCADTSKQLAELLRQFPYVPVAVVYLGVQRSDVAHSLDGFGFLVAEGEDLRVLGTVFESVIYPGRAPEGHVLFRCIFGGARDPSIIELSDEDIIAQAVRDVSRALELPSLAPVHTHVVRWPRAIAQYPLGHLERVRRAETLAHPLGLVLAGSAYHGVAVNKVVADAARVRATVTQIIG